VNDFSESIATGAHTDLTEYHRRKNILGRTVGGRRSVGRSLIYSEDKLKPSKESIGALGEGIAGEYLEKYEGLHFEIRPFGVSPDLIFRNKGGARILAEVKTSLERFPAVTKVAVELLDILAKTRIIRRGKYSAYVVAVKINDPTSFELRRLSIEEV
jgi:hypothetical protein